MGDSVEKRPVGRPSLRSPELELEILTRIASGETLSEICRDDGMPDRATVQRWAIDDAEFAASIARAREEQAEVYSDEIIELADKAVSEDSAGVQARKLMVDTRKWLMAKRHPRRYGDFQRTEITGELDVKLTDEQLESRLTQLLGKAGVVAPAGGAGPKEGS